LSKKERISVPEIELTDYAAEELDRKLRSISAGMVVRVVYYRIDRTGGQPIGECLQVSGKVSRIEPYQGQLVVVDTKIPIKDIRDLEILPH